MKFQPVERLKNPQTVTGKAPDADVAKASATEVAETVNKQIAELSEREIFAQGFLHRDGETVVDGWSGFAGRLVR
jgi:hypothetical protein